MKASSGGCGKTYFINFDRRKRYSRGGSVLESTLSSCVSLPPTCSALNFIRPGGHSQEKTKRVVCQWQHQRGYLHIKSFTCQLTHRAVSYDTCVLWNGIFYARFDLFANSSSFRWITEGDKIVMSVVLETIVILFEHFYFQTSTMSISSIGCCRNSVITKKNRLLFSSAAKMVTGY